MSDRIPGWDPPLKELAGNLSLEALRVYLPALEPDEVADRQEGCRSGRLL
jgi:hypothetical protein